MKHIRIGKDISLRWAITTDGAAVPLEGRDLTLEMKSPIGKVIILPYRIDGNVITMTYYGYEQTVERHHHRRGRSTQAAARRTRQ